MPQNLLPIIKDYFMFSKGQRRAFICLVSAIGLCVFLPAINNYLEKSVSAKADPILIQEVAGLKVYNDSLRDFKKEDGENADFAVFAEPKSNQNPPASLFFFDPNTASASNWQKLGLKDKTIATIQKYLAKGGHFYKPEDLKKIYGLRESEVAALLPFVRIVNNSPNKPFRDFVNTTHYNNEKGNKTLRVDVNLADTSIFKALPGIGSKLAARIVNFRNKLGGFYAVEQVGETFGLPDSTFQKIKLLLVISSGPMQKRNINTATVDELKTPYIPYNVANAIVQYRTHNGNFNAVEDLKKIPLIDDDLFVKIAPYLSVN